MASMVLGYFRFGAAPMILAALVAASLASCRRGSRGASADAQLQAETTPLSDEQVKEALDIIGVNAPGGNGFCAAGCHGSGTGWHELSQAEVVGRWVPMAQAMSRCFEAASTPMGKIDCFRENGQFTADSVKRLSIYRAAAKHSTFQEMFQAAFGENSSPYQEFLLGRGTRPSAQMPVPDGNMQGLHGFLSDEESKKVITVFTHPDAAAKISQQYASGPSIAQDCQTKISEELRAHIKEMRYMGWGAELTSSPEKRRDFYGCRYKPTDFDPIKSPIQQCFTDPAFGQRNFEFPWAENWDQAVDPVDGRVLKQGIRILSDLGGCRTTFWMRSSPDGRFVGNGAKSCPDGVLDSRSRGFFVDLLTKKTIGVDAPYDPGFCPDNSCFTFVAMGSSHFCKMESLMPRSNGSQPNYFAMAAPENKNMCTNGGLSVYQHIGAALDGARYLVVRTDMYANDDGTAITEDPPVEKFATEDSWGDVYKMCEGNKCGIGLNESIARQSDTPYGFTKRIVIPSPYEGDFGISPSSLFLTSRISRQDGSGQLGYRIRMFDVDSTRKDNHPSSRTPVEIGTSREVGTVCMKGGKASVSFDERYLVTHHYTATEDWQELNKGRKTAEMFQGPEDPRFAKLVQNSSNIWLTDLWTGQTMRLTSMAPGQFALYPHFRADGWLYFLVRDQNSRYNYVAASDAALRLSVKYPMPRD